MSFPDSVMENLNLEHSFEFESKAIPIYQTHFSSASNPERLQDRHLSRPENMLHPTLFFNVAFLSAS